MRTPPWALVQHRVPGDPRIRPGILAGGTVFEPPFESGSLMEALAGWDSAARTLRDWPAGAAGRAGPDARLAAPLIYPGAVLCSGANYHSHAAEMGSRPLDPDGEPFFFLKPPRTTVIGPGAPVPCPPGAQLDWEAELGVVIGHTAKNVTRTRPARSSPGTWPPTTCRPGTGPHATTRPRRTSSTTGWRTRARTGSAPLGPGIVPAWQVADPQRLAVRLSVNGVTKQDESTADMVLGVDRLVAAASRLMPLHPGDVILTGTPAGVGAARGEFLAPGDEVVVSIDGIGVLSNQVVAG
jgi:2-keto-4-pentenoate hydratase/2-oxohepta-3-ene-1,7-dioic acid hydratase in catechol pathway